MHSKLNTFNTLAWLSYGTMAVHVILYTVCFANTGSPGTCSKRQGSFCIGSINVKNEKVCKSLQVSRAEPRPWQLVAALQPAVATLQPITNPQPCNLHVQICKHLEIATCILQVQICAADEESTRGRRSRPVEGEAQKEAEEEGRVGLRSMAEEEEGRCGGQRKKVE